MDNPPPTPPPTPPPPPPYRYRALVFALGSNGEGQLGVGNKSDIDSPRRAMFSSPDISHAINRTFLDTSVAKIVGGGNHTLLLTEDGKLYWAGIKKTPVFPMGSLHILHETPDTSANGYFPHFYQFNIGAVMSGVAGPDFKPPFRVQNVTATFEASIVAIRDSMDKTRVWSCGKGYWGELGLGVLSRKLAENMNALLPVRDFVPSGIDIVDLAASMHHVVAVLSNGEVWGWGAGRKGQLGTPIQAKILTPRKINDVPFSVRRAVCGVEFTCFFGDPTTGEFHILGSNKYNIQSSAPTKDLLAGWKDVGASFGGIYVLKHDGTLQCWGRNDKHQIPPSDVQDCTEIGVGSEHVVVIHTANKARAWGWNEHGNCGSLQARQGSVISLPSRIDSSTDVTRTMAAAGWATSWIVVIERAPLDVLPPTAWIPPDNDHWDMV